MVEFSRCLYLIPLLLSPLAPAAAQGESAFGKGWKQPTLNSPHWPSWAHEHWVWENEGDEKSAYALVDGYLQRGIPVSALIIDRPWDIAPSNFTPDPKRYPNMKQLIAKLHSRDVKVMLWAVSVLNNEAPEFEEAKAKGYFLNGGRQIRWWAGWGGMLDYENPQAVDWWHSRMNQVLDMGIDGWKLDGTDPFSILASVNGPLSLFRSISIWEKYRERYYTDFWKYSTGYTKKKFVISGRPVDSFNNPYLPRLLDPFYSFTPYEMSFAGWVGDQDGNWDGLRAAIANMKESAARGYLSFGSDTSGFRSSGGMRDKELFVRWTQLSAFNGVLENGGSGEHRPWLYGPEVEAIYRRFVKLHHALVPYIFSSAAWAFENRGSLYLNFEKLGAATAGRWDFLFGPALAVASFDGPQSRRTVHLPEGEWLDFFDPTKIIAAKKFIVSPSLDAYPVFIRNGAIFPMRNLKELGAFEAPGSRDPNLLNVMVFPREGEQSFPVYNDQGNGGTLAYKMDGSSLRVSAMDLTGLGWLRVRAPASGMPKSLRVNGKRLPVEEVSESKGAWWIPLSACGEASSCVAAIDW